MRTLSRTPIRGPLFALGSILLLSGLPALAQSEGQALHVFVGKSVVINMQAPVSRILSSNPSVIDTLATSPTQVVVEGKAPGVSSLILWDSSGHSQILDVTVDVNISHLRTAIEQTYPGQQVNLQSDGAHLILTGTVSDAKISEDIGKMAVSIFRRGGEFPVGRARTRTANSAASEVRGSGPHKDPTVWNQLAQHRRGQYAGDNQHAAVRSARHTGPAFKYYRPESQRK